MREEFAPRCIALGHFLLEEYKLYVPNCFAALKGIGSVRADGLLPRENGLIPNENSIRISVPEGEKEIDMKEKIKQEFAIITTRQLPKFISIIYVKLLLFITSYNLENVSIKAYSPDEISRQFKFKIF